MSTLSAESFDVDLLNIRNLQERKMQIFGYESPRDKMQIIAISYFKYCTKNYLSAYYNDGI